MRSFWSKEKIIALIIFIALIALSLALIYYIQTDHLANKNSVFLTNGNEIEVHYSIFVATLALVFIAYIEFERSNKLNTNELLTFISNRWSSKEIIKARQIIHEIFVGKYRYDKTSNPNEDFPIAVRNTSLEVYEMSKKISNDGKKFVYLLNLLDHFENISYLSKNHQIDLKDIKNIYGNNINFYYEIFERYIQQRQKYLPDDFSNFRKIYSQLNPK